MTRFDFARDQVGLVSERRRIGVSDMRDATLTAFLITVQLLLPIAIAQADFAPSFVTPSEQTEILTNDLSATVECPFDMTSLEEDLRPSVLDDDFVYLLEAIISHPSINMGMNAPTAAPAASHGAKEAAPSPCPEGTSGVKIEDKIICVGPDELDRPNTWKVCTVLEGITICGYLRLVCTEGGLCKLNYSFSPFNGFTCILKEEANGRVSVTCKTYSFWSDNEPTKIFEYYFASCNGSPCLCVVADYLHDPETQFGPELIICSPLEEIYPIPYSPEFIPLLPGYEQAFPECARDKGEG